MQNARVDRQLCHDNGREAFDYHGEVAGPTVGSHRLAVWAKRWTKSTRAFAPRSGANVELTSGGLMEKALWKTQNDIKCDIDQNATLLAV